MPAGMLDFSDYDRVDSAEKEGGKAIRQGNYLRAITIRHHSHSLQSGEYKVPMRDHDG